MKHEKYLKIAVELAEEAFKNGDEPFGSLLVLDDKILFKGHNEVSSGDHTRHPEFEIAKWAANNLTIEERQRAVCYTSNEHCPMCAAAHGWVMLGDIHYAVSSKQLSKWYKEFNYKGGYVKPLPIKDVIINTNVYGPYDKFVNDVKELHEKFVLSKK